MVLVVLVVLVALVATQFLTYQLSCLILVVSMVFGGFGFSVSDLSA